MMSDFTKSAFPTGTTDPDTTITSIERNLSTRDQLKEMLQHLKEVQDHLRGADTDEEPTLDMNQVTWDLLEEMVLTDFVRTLFPNANTLPDLNTYFPRLVYDAPYTMRGNIPIGTDSVMKWLFRFRDEDFQKGDLRRKIWAIQI